MAVRGIRVVHWNPRRRSSRPAVGRLLPRISRPNNFGDLLGPLLVSRLAHGLPRATSDRRLLSIGSILQFARTGDVVWGSGVNGKSEDADHRFTDLDVRAVRGPVTRERLLARGVDVPEVFGDPGLLVPRVFPEIAAALRPGRHQVTVVPNLHDVGRWQGSAGFLDPRGSVRSRIRRIAESRHVVASSLHGIVIAEAFGVPASLLRPAAEPLLKYHDYFEGTGRSLPRLSDSVAEALDHPAPPLTGWSGDALLAAFPADLWTARRAVAVR